MHDDDIESRLRAAMQEATRPVTGTGVDEEEIHRTVERRRRQRKIGLAGMGGGLAAAAIAAVVLLNPSGDDGVSTDKPPADSSEPDPTVTVAPTTTEPTAESTTTSTTAGSLPEFPPQEPGLTHGAPAWAVYLAIAPPESGDAPEIVAAGQAMVDAGYTAFPEGQGSDLGCDIGAPEALGRDATSVAVAAYFGTEELANQAKAAFEARGTTVVAVVDVKTGCLD